jgi:hypothetical protein
VDPGMAPDPQTIMVLTDRAAWSRPRQILEAARKGRPPDPGLPIRGLCSDPTAYRRRGSEVRGSSPNEAGFAAVWRSFALRAKNGALKRSPRFERRCLGKITKYLDGPSMNQTGMELGRTSLAPLWDIPPAAARLGKSLPANTTAFESFLTNLELMYSAFICAHPRCPKDPDLPAIRYAIKEFMEEQAPSNFSKERWAASYDPARKVTYCSWFLGTIAFFLDKLDFTTLTPPPIEPKPPIFIAEQPRAPSDLGEQAPFPSSASQASGRLGEPAAKPGRKSRRWNAGGPAGLAALEARNAAERQALLRHAPPEASSAWARPVGKTDRVQPGDACPPGEASSLPRRSGKRPPDD